MEDDAMDSASVAAALQGRQAVYTLLARAWADALDADAASVLGSSDWETVLALFEEDGGQSPVGQWRAVAAAIDRWGVADAERAFNWCFMGVGTRVAPWESVYVTGERLVFQPSTLAVREAYAAWGLAARKKGSEPDDHIATECDFMAKMAQRAAGAFSDGDDVGCKKALVASRAFLSDHLASFAVELGRSLAQACEEAVEAGVGSAEVVECALALYGELSRFSAAFFECDGKLIDELIGAL
ncbi:molecular chaperone TorD family protein [Adlercreutzia sp. R21]|uniref:TorD/DmsD family molecular chaperone n=1 Tax=Adlercreutzia wanghongyangiae TaxID=3111451 RepID=UPI002DB63379|nr:molecular chaperone TorD family protein [Adlercreutzia sp. R21]MEC4183542.1 molecular chaperone TorD family protein [Adlercreutzia sp. R21]